MIKDPMLDENFLKELCSYKHQFIWAKIISLNFQEDVLEEIQGVITGGNISIDGKSSVRRTCSLSMTAKDVNINDFNWGLNTKFRVEIGLENHIDPSFPRIVWFKMGMFLISSFSCNLTTNSYTISISGKDKMVLLNGEVGGVVPASWDFATEDITEKDGSITNRQIPIKDIVLQAVHEFAQEPWQNIIVNDLDDYGIELLEYQGDEPFYYLIDTPGSGVNDSRSVSNMTLDGDMKCDVKVLGWDEDSEKAFDTGLWLKGQKLGELNLDAEYVRKSANVPVNIQIPKYSYEKLIEQLDPSGNATETKDYVRTVIRLADGKEYTVAKITKDAGSRVCGYRICDIVYPYDLVVAPGGTITSSVLDKLVSMLGNFEYFYDVDGRFIFQKKKTYTDVSYNNIVNEHTINSEVWADSATYNRDYTFSFEKSELISSISNSPAFANLKNDFSLWGTKKSGDIEIPIHMRYAIDHKPFYYKSIGNHIKRNQEGKSVDKNGNVLEGLQTNAYYYDDAGTVYITKEYADITGIQGKVVDWREIIYQMANDYRRHYREPDFNIAIRDNSFINGDYLFPKGYTGYEKYYIDFEMNLSQGVVAYWRELYNIDAAGQTGSYASWGDFISDASARNYAAGSYRKGELVKYQGKVYKSLTENNTSEPNSKTTRWVEFIGGFSYNSTGWNPNILNSPESLNFWFDFLDTTGPLNKYSVCNIGQRTKAVNDNKIKAIYFSEVPNVIFQLPDDIRQSNWVKPGYAHITIPKELDDLFTISTRGKNAMETTDEYLHNYAYVAQSISMSSIPIYYLKPNTLIYVNDDDSGIVGKYILTGYSFQFGLTTNMNLSAVEVVSNNIFDIPSLANEETKTITPESKKEEEQEDDSEINNIIDALISAALKLDYLTQEIEDL